MRISQTRLDAMIVEQRRMFPGENLIIDSYCEGMGVGESSDAHRFTPTFIPRAARRLDRNFGGSHPCIFWCERCETAVTMHRYGRPFIDPTGKLVRRCLNDGTNRRHTSDDRERCTDKHVLLKRHQLERGIYRFRSQMSDPDAQLVRERERQERRLTTNERPSEFDSTLVRINSTQRAPRPMTDFTARLQRDGLITSEGG